MKRIFVYLFLIIGLLGCKHPDRPSDYIELNVDLNKTENELHEVFDKIEVITLETNDSSFLVYPYKIIENLNKFYIYDIHTQKVLMFAGDGKYIRNIGNKGEGPGEYPLLSSISIDRKEETIQLLIPYGYYLDYTLDGQFKNKSLLPQTKPNYQDILHINDKIVTWTIPLKNEDNCISIIDQNTKEIVAEHGSGPSIIKTCSNKIYTYNDKAFYAQTLESNYVYELTEDSMILTYGWNFGDDNIDMSKLDLSFDNENVGNEKKKLQKYIKTGIIPYWIVTQEQNDKYYFACLRYLYEKYDKCIFFHKENGNSFLFGSKNNSISLYPYVFTDEYLICVLHHADFDKWKPLLVESECEKLKSIKEDDNPCLLKLYFK